MHYNYNSRSPPTVVRRRSMGTLSVIAASAASGTSAGVLTIRYAAYTHANGQNTGSTPVAYVMHPQAGGAGFSTTH